MSADFKDTILYHNRIEHLKKIVRGDMIHLISLDETDRRFVLRTLAKLNDVANAWINAKVSLQEQMQARDQIEKTIEDDLNEYYNQAYAARFGEPKPEQNANTLHEPYGLHFQPYGIETKTYVYDLNKESTGDWLNQCSPEYKTG